MTWWTTSSLTPLAVYDANHISNPVDSNNANIVFLSHCDSSSFQYLLNDLKSHPTNKFGSVRFENYITRFNSSIYLDGTEGTGLQVPIISDLQLNSNDFCIETWIYSNGVRSGTPDNRNFIFNYGGGYNYAVPNLAIANHASLGLQVVIRSSATEGNPDIADYETVGYTISSTFYHIALTRSGSIFRLFLNGSLIWSKVDSRAIHSTSNLAGLGIGCAAYSSTTLPSQCFYGYIDEIRITNGSARYTSTFTPKNSEFSLIDTKNITLIDQIAGKNIQINNSKFNNKFGFNSISSLLDGNRLDFEYNPVLGDPFYSNVNLLMNSYGANFSTSFVDNSNNVTLTTLGNTRVSIDKSKFGVASILFDGNGDALVASNAEYFDAMNNITVEMWINPSSLNVEKWLVAKALNTNPSPYQIRISSNNHVVAYITTDTNSYNTGDVGTTLTTNQWYHIALVKQNNLFLLFVDGILTGTPILAAGAFINNNAPLCIGAYSAGSLSTNPNGSFNGYIDNFRFTASNARYSENFTPPSSQFATKLNSNVTFSLPANATIVVFSSQTNNADAGNFSTPVSNQLTQLLRFDGNQVISQESISYPLTSNKDKMIAFTRAGNSARFYADKNFISAETYLSTIPSLYSFGNANIFGHIIAIGVFEGRATLADLKILEDAIISECKTFTVSSKTYPILTLRQDTNSNVSTAFYTKKVIRQPRDFNGSGYISGQVIKNGAPVSTNVTLFDKKTKIVLQQVKTDQFGVYRFNNVDKTRTYLVYAEDLNQLTDGIIKDRIVPYPTPGINSLS